MKYLKNIQIGKHQDQKSKVMHEVHTNALTNHDFEELLDVGFKNVLYVDMINIMK